MVGRQVGGCAGGLVGIFKLYITPTPGTALARALSSSRREFHASNTGSLTVAVASEKMFTYQVGLCVVSE